MLNEECINRLYNWKFGQALQYLEEGAEERELILALQRLFGNSPYITGDMGLLVTIAVESLIGKQPD